MHFLKCIDNPYFFAEISIIEILIYFFKISHMLFFELGIQMYGHYFRPRCLSVCVWNKNKIVTNFKNKGLVW